MRKSLISLVAFASGISNLSMYSNPATHLLERHDYDRMQRELSSGPALSGPLDGSPYWSSYNQWLCFPTTNLDTECLETEFEDRRKIPALHITEGAHFFEFSLDPNPAPNCEKITKRWRALLRNESEFCVYAAPLQEFDTKASDVRGESGSVWIMRQLKTAKGYWNFESSDNWLLPDEEDNSTESGSESASSVHGY